MIRHALRKKMLMRQKLNVGRRKVILLEDTFTLTISKEKFDLIGMTEE